MNRYQKPEVYEQLAMEYSLGTLHGHARKRFERLMEVHPYLQAMVEDNDRKFAELIEFVPGTKPNDYVWENIKARINQSEQEQNISPDSKEDTSVGKDSWWQFLRNRGLATAMVLLAVTTLFLVQPWKVGGVDNTTYLNEIVGFSAILESLKNKKPMVDVKIMKDDLLLTVQLIEPVEVSDGMKVVFWCIAKDKNTPIMNMGVVAAQGVTKKKLDEKDWKGIIDASQFAVSIEDEANAANSSPTGELLFVGKLKALTRT